MHPIAVLIPAAALAFMPGLWAKKLLKRHNERDLESLPKGRELARLILDENGLQRVRVECTDVGDHYDPQVKAVRLARDKYDRNSLAAVTTAAHEAAHALQDATGYLPFVWRSRLVALARVTGQVGSVLLIAVPTAAMLGRRPIPAEVIIVSLFTMLATGLAAQVAAVPTELDASFRRALPLLRSRFVDEAQARDVREILLATSSTYVAASLLSVLNIWPWLGTPGRGMPITALSDSTTAVARVSLTATDADADGGRRLLQGRGSSGLAVRHRSMLARCVRVVAKPMIRGWFQLSRSLP